MLKIFFLINLFTLFLIEASSGKSNIFIYATINDQIITNFDIEKESEYLKLLNPKLSEIDNQRVLNLGKNSLIREIIKKKEIEKIFDLEKENPLIDQYLENLYKNLNFQNEKEFELSLSKKGNYSLADIKEKLKIELLWNDLIYGRFISLIKIDKQKLNNKIESLNNETRKEYLLSEIVFEKKQDIELETLKNKIERSISEIGFNNAANIYSISENSKFGGKIGWIDENNLSLVILNELKKIDKGQHTKIFKIGKNYLIIKIDEIRLKKIEINKKEELEKMVQFETNKQLNQFSIIYFNKVKINYSINEN